MSDQEIPTPHGPVTIAGQDYEHVYGPWMPHSRTSQWRTCTVPGCHEHQSRQVKA